MSRILLALDHTDDAAAATRSAIDKARAESSDLVIAGLASATADLQPAAGERRRQHRAVQAAITSAAKEAADAGVDATVLNQRLFVDRDRDARLRALAAEVGANEIVYVAPAGGILRKRGTVTHVALAERDEAEQRELLAA